MGHSRRSVPRRPARPELAAPRGRGRPLHPAVDARGADHSLPRCGRPRDLREAAGRFRRRLRPPDRGRRAGRCDLGRPVHADLPVPLRRRRRPGASADRRRDHRPSVHGVVVHLVAARQGLLRRRALARDVGGRARRLRPQPLDPQPRPAHVDGRPARRAAGHGDHPGQRRGDGGLCGRHRSAPPTAPSSR